ncbi:MAG: hypothetical protein IJD95_04825 [Clostridia bacterium]|nr:hypothetical protein [Clostridia bacterium]
MKISVPYKAKKIIERFNAHGKQAYIVGGAVRDIILRREVSDIDITTDALPDETKAIFYDCKTVDTGIGYGTLTLFFEGDRFEITVFRSEHGYSDGRHPDGVTFEKSLLEDLFRRDFTVNALAADASGSVTDAVNGIFDIENGIIRAVGDPFERFCEDKLRIMRAVRFCASLDFLPDERTLEAAIAIAPLLHEVSGERLGAEFTKVLPFLNSSHLAFLPIISSCLGVSLEREALCRIDKLKKGSEVEFYFAALLKDIAPMRVKQILLSLSISKKIVEKVAFLIENYGMLFCNNGEFIDFVLLHGTDKARLLLDFAKAFGFDASNFSSLLNDGDRCFSISKLQFDGNDAKKLNIHGKDIGNALSAAVYEVAHGRLSNSKDDIAAYIKSRFIG